jgi:hypothetical protein
MNGLCKHISLLNQQWDHDQIFSTISDNVSYGYYEKL